MHDDSLAHRRFFALVMVGLTSASTVLADEVQVGRYSTVRAAPTAAQANLLSALVTVAFPPSVTTVGQAVDHLLKPSGYRLAPQAFAEPSRTGLLGLPLPDAHRVLGPMSMQTALETLAGPAFRLVEDPVHRLVTFERCGATEPERSAPARPGRR